MRYGRDSHQIIAEGSAFRATRSPLDSAIWIASLLPEGIEKLEQLDVNGSKQWISIRGLNRANPILLVLHGGPGDGNWYGKKDLSFEEPGRFLLTLVNVVLPLAGGSPGQ